MSLGLNTTFTLDMVPGGPPPILHASAGDSGRKYKANLTYNGEPYDIQGNILKIRGTKPDGTTFEEDPDDYERDDSWVDIMLTEQMTNVPGRVVCEIVEKLNSNVISSANFILEVEEPAYTAVSSPSA